MPKKIKQPSERAAPSPPGKQNVPAPVNFKELCDRSNRDDPAAQAEVCRALDANPDLCRSLGDLASHAQRVFVRLVAKNNFVFAESVRRRTAELRKELAGAFPTPLELLAVERVVAAWLQVQHVEMQIALADDEIPKAKFWLQRQLQANRLYHAATKSLLLIRELLPPAAPPTALAANGTAGAAPHCNGRLLDSANGESSHRKPKSDTVPMNRINGLAKNGTRREMASV